MPTRIAQQPTRTYGVTGQTFEACHKECSQKPKPTKQPTNQPASQSASQPALARPAQTNPAQASLLSNAQPSPAAQPGTAQDPVQVFPAEPRPAQLGSAAQTRSQIIQASCTQLGQPVFFPLAQALQTLWAGRICVQMGFILSWDFRI